MIKVMRVETHVVNNKKKNRIHGIMKIKFKH